MVVRVRLDGFVDLFDAVTGVFEFSVERFVVMVTRDSLYPADAWPQLFGKHGGVYARERHAAKESSRVDAPGRKQRELEKSKTMPC